MTAPDGRPRIAILSIAHLGESERMFFVTTLLNELVSWVRSQSGTSSLRALLYMDEIFGYFPPTAAPPSKKPMLTLLKQARASGLGVLLATQNPADLDYKGLANTGTWFLGRLQTERDKLRVLEGLEGAAAATGAAFDPREMDEVLAGLPGRVFLAHNVHEDAPLLFQTRWAMSYLRGPLQREQIQRLMAPRKSAAAAAPAPAVAEALRPSPTAAAAAPAGAGARPILPPEIEERFLAGLAAGGRSLAVGLSPAPDRPRARALRQGGGGRRSVAGAVGDGRCPRRPTRRSSGRRPRWTRVALETSPRDGASFEPPPAPVLRAKSWAAWRKQLEAVLYRDQRLVLWKNAALGAQSSRRRERGRLSRPPGAPRSRAARPRGRGAAPPLRAEDRGAAGEDPSR